LRKLSFNCWVFKMSLILCIISDTSLHIFISFIEINGGRHGRDCMVVGFTTTYICNQSQITTNVSSNPSHGEVYSIQHNVIKFVSDLWQVGGFLWVLRIHPSIKLTTTIFITEMLLNVALNTITLLMEINVLSTHCYMYY